MHIITIHAKFSILLISISKPQLYRKEKKEKLFVTQILTSQPNFQLERTIRF